MDKNNTKEPSERINWRAKIPQEFIKVNKEAFKNKELPTSTEGLADNQLLILLGGIRWVAAERGLISRLNKVDYISHDKAVVTATVTFAPSDENPHGLTYSDTASATFDNTAGFGQIFLETIASNRAFVRAVRNALGINIVGQDEIVPTATTGVSYNNDEPSDMHHGSMKPTDVLKEKVIRYFKKKEGKTIEFLEFKDYVAEKNMPKIKTENWGDDWSSIPGNECFILMQKIQG